MRCLACAVVLVTAVTGAASLAAADPAPVGAHVACFVGKEKAPIQKRRKIDKPLTCSIVIDQGEPPPSAHAQLALVQDGQPATPPVHNADQFVPQDDGDGIYYPFPETFKPGGDFKACKDFNVKARIVDGDKELWRGGATVETLCKAPRKLALVFACHWDGDLVCVLQTKNLKTKVPAGVVGRIKLGGGTKPPVQDAFTDYPDDTYAVEAKFARADVPCSGASVEAVAEIAETGQSVFASTITAPPCPN
jgi:hypothetical protein